MNTCVDVALDVSTVLSKDPDCTDSQINRSNGNDVDGEGEDVMEDVMVMVALSELVEVTEEVALADDVAL